MKFIPSIKTTHIGGKQVTFASAQLTDLRRLDMQRSARIIAQGTTMEPGEVMAVLELISSRLPAVLADGNKLDLGFAYIVPTVSGSIKEEDWRTARVKRLMEANPTWSQQKATSEQQKEPFTAKALTSKMLTAGYSLQRSNDFSHGVNDRVEWERVATGEADADSSSASGNGGTGYVPDQDGLGS